MPASTWSPAMPCRVASPCACRMCHGTRRWTWCCAARAWPGARRAMCCWWRLRPSLPRSLSMPVWARRWMRSCSRCVGSCCPSITPRPPNWRNCCWRAWRMTASSLVGAALVSMNAPTRWWYTSRPTALPSCGNWWRSWTCRCARWRSRRVSSRPTSITKKAWGCAGVGRFTLKTRCRARTCSSTLGWSGWAAASAWACCVATCCSTWSSVPWKRAATAKSSRSPRWSRPTRKRPGSSRVPRCRTRKPARAAPPR
ncbi:hypothetical protein D3C79_485650 [compost metagenome]